MEWIKILLLLSGLFLIAWLLTTIFYNGENSDYELVFYKSKWWDTNDGLRHCNYYIYQHKFFKFRIIDMDGYNPEGHPYYEEFLELDCKNYSIKNKDIED